MKNVYICDGVRTPIGRYGGALSSIRTDDLAALPLQALQKRNPNVDWHELDEVIMGCANQAGEDNRNVARMATLLSGMPHQIPAMTINRLCGSGMDAVGTVARAIKTGELSLAIAGGVESMSRAPLVMGKSEQAFGRNQVLHDTTMAWRFINRKMEQSYGTESMPETAENLAEKFGISREQQDEFAFWSQKKVKSAVEQKLFSDELIPVEIVSRKQSYWVEEDEHPRPDTKMDSLARLKTPFRDNGTVTAGNASGINDGAAALLLANKDAIGQHGLTPIARILGMSTAGVEPKFMGIGPVPAVKKLLAQHHLQLDDMDVIELNEAFAAQALACMQQLELSPEDPRVNPNGGAIALGHPLGVSGARLVMTAAYQLKRNGGRYALCTMCIGVGQGIAILIENVHRSIQ